MDQRERFQGAFRGWNLNWEGWRRNSQGEWWLLSQGMLILAVIGLPSWPYRLGQNLPALALSSLELLGGVILLLGIGLAVLAFWTLGENLSPLPDPKPGIAIVCSGPYRLCRHPLYLAVLICSFGVLLLRQSPLHMVLLLTLVGVLRGKAQREERGLLQRHPNYRTVMGQIPAIAPWIPGLNWQLQNPA